MRFFSPLLILVALLAAACGGAVLPDEFTRERADGKIPVSIPLIRQQTQKEMDGMPEGQAKVERWQQIEEDHNQCRLLSARSSQAEANEVFAACMSKREYVYMHRLDAEQLHDDIAAQMVAQKKATEKAIKKAEEESRLAAERKREEERIADEKRAEEERIATEKKVEEERKIAAEKAEQERLESNLITAAINGNLPEVKRLLDAGVDPNAVLLTVDENTNEAKMLGGPALAHAAYSNNSEMVKVLLDAGAKPNIIFGFAATSKKDAEWIRMAKVLLDAGAHPDTKVSLVNFEITYLMVAVQSNHPKAVKMFLSSGANPNALYNEDGNTALMYASERGYAEIAQMLLAAGANPNAAKDDGVTALMLAARYGHSEIVKMLLATGTNPNVKVFGGTTALGLAVASGHSEVVKMLLDAGANPNVQDIFGTALMQAVLEGTPEIVKMLLDAGANPNAADKKGQTALMQAEKDGHPNIIQMLLDAGAKRPVREYTMDELYGKDKNDRRVIYSGINAASVKEYYSGGEKRIGVAAPFRPGYFYDTHTQKFRLIEITPEQQQRPKTKNSAAQVFENAWRNIVVVRQGDNQGSGVVVRPNVVATNCHVIDSGGRIVIYKHDNRRATTDTTYNAVIRKRDTARDFCLLNVAGLQGIPAKLRRYNTLDIGEDVYAVGSPRGLDLSLSSGIISQLRQGTNTRYIQTDASVSPGSSGGGLFDSAGNLIGILTAKIADEDVEGIGFAIPADLAVNL